MSPPVFSKVESTSDLRAPVVDALLGFLWQQWSQMGISGDAPLFHDRWLIDPEALLLFTLRLGRFDPRLFDEVMDWCVRNGEGLSIQRLKTLSKPLSAIKTNEPDINAQTLGAFAATLLAQTHSVRWRTLLLPEKKIEQVSAREPVPFFLEPTGEPLPTFNRTAPQFLAAGLLRAPVMLRGMSMPPPVDAPPCLILKLRTLFGLDPRAEVIAYLLTHPIAGTRELARATGYAPSTIHTVLSRLSAGRFLRGGPRSGYEAEPRRWHAFLGESLPEITWIDWAGVLPALAVALESLAPLPEESAYLRSSRLLRSGERLGATLIGSGLPNIFDDSWQIDSAAEKFADRLLQLVRFMNGEAAGF